MESSTSTTNEEDEEEEEQQAVVDDETNEEVVAAMVEVAVQQEEARHHYGMVALESKSSQTLSRRYQPILMMDTPTTDEKEEDGVAATTWNQPEEQDQTQHQKQEREQDRQEPQREKEPTLKPYAVGVAAATTIDIAGGSERTTTTCEERQMPHSSATEAATTKGTVDAVTDAGTTTTSAGESTGDADSNTDSKPSTREEEDFVDSTNREVAVVDSLQPNDVLTGRGPRAWNHAGNQYFRQIINYNVSQYVAAKTFKAKSTLIRSIIAYMQMELGTRFLKEIVPKPQKTETASSKEQESQPKDNDSTSHEGSVDDNDNAFLLQVLDRKETHSKVGHAFRDALKRVQQGGPEEQQETQPSTSSTSATAALAAQSMDFSTTRQENTTFNYLRIPPTSPPGGLAPLTSGSCTSNVAMPPLPRVKLPNTHQLLQHRHHQTIQRFDEQAWGDHRQQEVRPDHHQFSWYDQYHQRQLHKFVRETLQFQQQKQERPVASKGRHGSSRERHPTTDTTKNAASSSPKRASSSKMKGSTSTFKPISTIATEVQTRSARHNRFPIAPPQLEGDDTSWQQRLFDQSHPHHSSPSHRHNEKRSGTSRQRQAAPTFATSPSSRHSHHQQRMSTTSAASTNESSTTRKRNFDTLASTEHHHPNNSNNESIEPISISNKYCLDEQSFDIDNDDVFNKDGIESLSPTVLATIFGGSVGGGVDSGDAVAASANTASLATEP